MAFFIPPPSYGMVVDNIYRCGLPNELNYTFLERLNLKKIIYLGPGEPDIKLYDFQLLKDSMNFVKDQNVEYVHLGKETQDSWTPLDEEVY